MKRSLGRRVAYLVAVLVLLLVGVPAAQAQDLLGTGPDFAMTPGPDWVSIEAGQYQWYVFRYDYDEKYGPMEIKLESSPEDSAWFTVRNGEQADLWRHDGKHEHFGAGSAVDRDANKDGKPDYQIWSAHMHASGTYYIVVERNRSVTGPVYYKLTVKGDGYELIDVPMPVAVVPGPAPAAQPAQPVAVTGGGPDLAIPMPTGIQAYTPSQVVAFGQQVWYYFDYQREFDTKDADLKTIEIRIYSDPVDVAHISIRNGDDAEAWRRDGTNQSFGRCSCVAEDKNEDGKPDYALWKGKLYTSGRYWIVVEHALNNPASATYRFEVFGL